MLPQSIGADRRRADTISHPSPSEHDGPSAEGKKRSGGRCSPKRAPRVTVVPAAIMATAGLFHAPPAESKLAKMRHRTRIERLADKVSLPADVRSTIKIVLSHADIDTAECKSLSYAQLGRLMEVGRREAIDRWAEVEALGWGEAKVRWPSFPARDGGRKNGLNLFRLKIPAVYLPLEPGPMGVPTIEGQERAAEDLEQAERDAEAEEPDSEHADIEAAKADLLAIRAAAQSLTSALSSSSAPSTPAGPSSSSSAPSTPARPSSSSSAPPPARPSSGSMSSSIMAETEAIKKAAVCEILAMYAEELPQYPEDFPGIVLKAAKAGKHSLSKTLMGLEQGLLKLPLVNPERPLAFLGTCVLNVTDQLKPSAAVMKAARRAEQALEALRAEPGPGPRPLRPP